MNIKAMVSRWLTVMALSLTLVLPQISVAEVIEEKPTALAMAADLALVRPALLVVTAVGTAIYVVSLPFSLIGGNADAAAQTLVLGPAEATFVRCLGCTKPGVAKKAYGDDE